MNYLFTILALLELTILAHAAHKPNIIIILADDMGYGDLGCYNSESKIRTPNMDRIASEGMRFTDAHSPASVCTPTRYALLTGRYCWRTEKKSGVLKGYDPCLIEPGRTTLASFLKENGYHTCGIGKWHLGFGNEKRLDYSKPLLPGPLSVGFHNYFGIPSSLDFEPYVYVRDAGVEALPTEKIAASGHRRQSGGGFWRAGYVAPGFRHIDVLPRTTEEAVSYINKRAGDAKSGRPFFMYFPLSAPHTPWMPTNQFQGKSKVGYYGDFVEQVDDAIGQVAAALEKNGLSNHTLLFITSDNGSHWPPGETEKWNHASNYHFRGQKADIYEGGHRVPFMARWPGRIPAGRVSDELICQTDFLKTFAALIGKELPNGAGEDSHSILPILLEEGNEYTPREFVIHHSGNGKFAIRKGKWKLIEGLGSGGFTRPVRERPRPGGPREQLYNLSTDIAESNNLYLQRPDVVQELSNLLRKARGV